MTVSPRVSIVLPLFNDEAHVAAALDSSLGQTLEEIEIIAIDDASTDRTAAIVEEYARRDARVRLIRQPINLSAFQARRAGVVAASGEFILFLDGDDELAPSAAETAWLKAHTAGADVVGFGVDILVADGRVPRRFEAALQPRHDRLTAGHILPQLFPAGEEANGHVWRYLWSAALLRGAYAGVSEDLAFYRANDIPITLLALADATLYVSVPQRLYRYHFRRGTSGHQIETIDDFRFLLSGIQPIQAIAGRMQEIAARSAHPDSLLQSYQSARLHIIANVLRYCVRDTSGDLQKQCLALLNEFVGQLDVVRAAACFLDDALPALSTNSDEPTQPATPARSVLLTTAHLGTGGLQGVLLDQAARLVEAGYSVTIAVARGTGRDVSLPRGVTLVVVQGNDRLARIDDWVRICADRTIDVIIDHHVLYNESWPWFVLAARGVGVPTIGWIHNFALRPLFDGSLRASFLALHLRLLLHVVVLSPTDVAFWKLRGLTRVSYLPNPASQLALEALAQGKDREHPSGRINLAWWGRLDPATKQVGSLVDVARELQVRGVDFHLTIIGPDSADLTASQLQDLATSYGVGDAISFTGELDAPQLLDALERAHLLVMTSAIEGSPLTIIEAQALGLPVAMFELPWLVTARDNDGILSTPSGDPALLADAIEAIAEDSERYATMSRAARAYARDVAETDHVALLRHLLSGTLPTSFSPEPDVHDAELLVEWLVRFAERNIRLKPTGTRADASFAAMRRERDRAERKLQQVMVGPSYRVGRVLTHLPRKLKAALPVARAVTERLRPHGRSKASGVTMRGHLSAPTPLRRQGDADVPIRSAAPDVSIVIPVFNAAPWVEDCVSSVLAQTGIDVEVICIDDGSTDNSGTILQRMSDTDPRVTVHSQENKGQSVARNRGLQAASGRYVMYLDSDDFWIEDSLAALVARADSYKLEVLLFDCVTFRDGDVDERTWLWYSSYYQRSRAYPEPQSGSALMAEMRANNDYRPHVGLYLARTEVVREMNLAFVPGIVHQDNPYTFRLLLNARRSAHSPLKLYARRIRPGSTITTLTPDRSARGYFLSYLEMTREVDRHGLPPETLKHIQNVVDYVFDGARGQFARISADVAEQIRQIDDSPDAQAAFESLHGRD